MPPLFSPLAFSRVALIEITFAEVIETCGCLDSLCFQKVVNSDRCLSGACYLRKLVTSSPQQTYCYDSAFIFHLNVLVFLAPLLFLFICSRNVFYKYNTFLGCFGFFAFKCFPSVFQNIEALIIFSCVSE